MDMATINWLKASQYPLGRDYTESHAVSYNLKIYFIDVPYLLIA
jgi:hypothetical protein